MKLLVTILTLCLLFLTAYANKDNRIPESLSSSYDGKWEGIVQTPEGPYPVKSVTTPVGRGMRKAP